MERTAASRSTGVVHATAQADAQRDLSATTAVILAGGLGTRLRSVVADRPKVLAEVDGVPFVFHLLQQLASAGVKHVVFSTGHLGDQVYDTVGASFGPLTIEYFQEASPLGTGGAIRHTLPLVRSQEMLLLNGDSYCDVDLGALAYWHHAHAAQGTLALSHVADARRFGTVQIDADGRVQRFSEKSPEQRAGTINAGIYLLRRALVATIPDATPCSLEQDLLPTWLARGIFGYARTGRFIDIGTPESLAGAAGFFRQPGRRSSAALTHIHTAEVA
jgi:D-glycero-alpha-D-manno-heptose 1-phosphate guanylyltransferase